MINSILFLYLNYTNFTQGNKYLGHVQVLLGVACVMQIIYNFTLKFGNFKVLFDSLAIAYLLFVNLVIIHALKISKEDLQLHLFYATKLMAAFFFFVGTLLFLIKLKESKIVWLMQYPYLGVYLFINVRTIFWLIIKSK